MEEKINILTDLLFDETSVEEASVNVGGDFNWVKFVVTDDAPNGNKTRIPQEEFANLIKSGIFAPIKMALGKIEEGHSDALPLGVITNLKQSGNMVEGLGALWTREREQDVATIRERVRGGKPPQLSWEITYRDSTVDDAGVKTVLGTSLTGVCVVGMPAYQGRTPITAFASVDTENKILEETSVEELESLKAKVAELESLLAEANKLVSAKEEELAALRDFKSEVEAKEAEAAKIKTIMDKFAEAGLSKDETYFEENKNKFLTMPEEAIDFMVQEMVAMASATKEVSSIKVPNISAPAVKGKSPKELAEALLKRN